MKRQQQQQKQRENYEGRCHVNTQLKDKNGKKDNTDNEDNNNTIIRMIAATIPRKAKEGVISTRSGWLPLQQQWDVPEFQSAAALRQSLITPPSPHKKSAGGRHADNL